MATILDPDLFYNHISHLVETKHKFDGGGSSIPVRNVISFTRVNLLTNLSRLYMVITAKMYLLNSEFSYKGQEAIIWFEFKS